MKIKFRSPLDGPDNVYSGEETIVAIIFKSDNEMRQFCNHMLSLPVTNEERWFVQSPKGMDRKKIADFMEVDASELNDQPSKNIFN